MKQCEPLKEPLNAPKECAPCPPRLRNRRRMPMGHVGIVVSEPVAGASDLIAVDAKTLEWHKMFISEILRHEPSPYYGGANIGSHKHIGDQQDPKDYAKKKKAKRRQQKQARHKNK